MPIQAGMVSKSIESAQRQVESMHFAARKNVLEYDDVMNLQRKAIYEERNAILDGKSMTERIPGIIRDAVDAIVGECCPGNSASDDGTCAPSTCGPRTDRLQQVSPWRRSFTRTRRKTSPRL